VAGAGGGAASAGGWVGVGVGDGDALGVVDGVSDGVGVALGDGDVDGSGDGDDVLADGLAGSLGADACGSAVGLLHPLIASAATRIVPAAIVRTCRICTLPIVPAVRACLCGEHRALSTLFPRHDGSDRHRVVT
jgi:hypothetical protein